MCVDINSTCDDAININSTGSSCDSSAREDKLTFVVDIARESVHQSEEDVEETRRDVFF